MQRINLPQVDSYDVTLRKENTFAKREKTEGYRNETNDLCTIWREREGERGKGREGGREGERGMDLKMTLVVIKS